MAIILIVVDVRMDLGDGGGGAGHEQEYDDYEVSEPHDARCVAVECVCVVESVVKLGLDHLFICGCSSFP